MEATEEDSVSVDTKDIDLSMLRKSLQARGKTIDQLVNCIYYGTTEVRQYILNESDIIIECKSCRNLFRALPNFVAHKRIYCLDSHLKVTIPLIKNSEEVISVNPEPPDDAQKFVDESINLAKKNLLYKQDMSAEVDSNDDSPHPDMVATETEFYERICDKLEKQKPDPTVGVRFETLEGTNVAVRVVPADKEHMTQHTNGITMVQKRKAGSVPMKIQTAPKMDIQTKREIKMKADFKHLRCLECNRTMSSRRYLIEHILNLHSDKRRFYSCPYCKVTFRYFHCVVRHLRRVHECSKDVIDNMREKLRSSSWIENSPVKPTNRVTQSSSSSQIKLEKVSKVSPKNKHEHHGKVPKLKVKLFGHKTTLGKSNSISSINNNNSNNNNRPKSSSVKNFNKSNTNNLVTHKVSAIVEPIPNLAIIKQEVISDEESQASIKSEKDSLSNVDKDSDVKDMTGKHRPPSIAQKKRMAILMDKKNLTCLQCQRCFSRMSGLVRHVAHHLGWKRFKCRLCMYSGYDRYVCKSHIERNHLGKTPGLTRKVIDYYIVDLEDAKSAQEGSKKKKPSSSKPKINSAGEKKTILSLSPTSPLSFESLVKPVTINANSNASLSSVATVRLSPLSNEQIKLSKGCSTSTDKPLKGSDLKMKLLSMVDYRTLKCLECNRTWNKRSHLLRHAAHHIGWKRFKCKLCVFSGYDRYMCKSHLKRCHLGKIHGLTVKVLDYYIVDMMEEDNEGI